MQLSRRRRVQVAAGPDRYLYVHTPEDILLQKLRWFRLGREVSDRQWRDVVGIVLVQGQALARDYLERSIHRTAKGIERDTAAAPLALDRTTALST